ncbi:MAG: dockerin type I repeat-containing protein [Planctomycetota bacterium]
MRASAPTCSLALALAFSGPALGQPRYFPLEPGNRWTYVSEEFGGERSIAVLAREGDTVLVRFSGRAYRLRVAGPPEAVDIELPGEGFVPYYRFGEASWLHRDVSACDDKRTLRAGGVETVDTPAGEFEGCLRLDYEGNQCWDAGRASEWWCPEVGLVRWTESSIAGVRVSALREFVRLGGRAKFLRGDADASSVVELTDAVYLLNHLVLGGPKPPCEDAADANDDGGLDISDAVSVLLYLFVGGAEPPFPGAEVPGFDATADDSYLCGDFYEAPRAWTAESTLPGASFDLSGNPPVLTLERAARGFSFVYRTVVREDAESVVAAPLDGGRCDRPDASGLAVLERIEGGGQIYCLCDVGRCAPGEHRGPLAAGVYEARFEWDGRNWYGPSDTSNPKGDPFPPGVYELRIAAAGTYVGVNGTESPYEMLGTLEFFLVP